MVASDAHRPGERVPSLSAAVAVLRRATASASRTEALVAGTPRALLEHGLVAAGAPGGLTPQPGRGRGGVAQAGAQLGEAHALIDDQDAQHGREQGQGGRAGTLTATG